MSDIKFMEDIANVCMSRKNTIKYQFTINRETWEEWKQTVPRTISLDTRIIELIKADLERRL